MPRTIALATIASAITLAGCSQAPEDEAPTAASIQSLATAALANPDGATIGAAALSGGEGSLTLSVEVEGLSEGPHGFHVHTTGDCSAADFTSAGGHLNPLGKSHGKDNPDGKHLGDLPNLEVAADGAGSASVELEGTPDDVLGHIFDDDGTAVVIHAGPDDYVSDPAGAAGARIACGVLARS